MARWLVEAWRKGENSPHTSTYIDDPVVLGVTVQVMLENGSNSVIITQTETVLVDTGTAFAAVKVPVK